MKSGQTDFSVFNDFSLKHCLASRSHFLRIAARFLAPEASEIERIRAVEARAVVRHHTGGRATRWFISVACDTAPVLTIFLIFASPSLSSLSLSFFSFFTLSLPFSFSHSLSHTHTHIYTHTHTYTHIHTHTHSLSLSLSLSRTHTHAHKHAHTHSHTHRTIARNFSST